MTKIIFNPEQKEIKGPVSLVNTHYQKKSCCGDCKGQGSCGKMTTVSHENKLQSEIAPINK